MKNYLNRNKFAILKIILGLFFLGVAITGMVFAFRDDDNEKSATTIQFVLIDDQDNLIIETDSCIISKGDPINDTTTLVEEIEYLNTNPTSCWEEKIETIYYSDVNGNGNEINAIDYYDQDTFELVSASVVEISFNNEVIDVIDNIELNKNERNILVIEI